MDKRDLDKKTRLLDALDKGMVMIHLDARRPGVLVPDDLRPLPHLSLNLSYRFDPPDLTVNDWGVRCTLSFSGVQFFVAVPWCAIFAMTRSSDGEPWMYPDDMPAELVQKAMVTVKTSPVETDTKPKAMLRQVLEQKGPAVEGEERKEEHKDEPKPASRGHLRVVK